MKVTSIKQFAPIIATVVGLALVSAVAHATRVDPKLHSKTRTMQDTSCTPTPSPSPGE